MKLVSRLPLFLFLSTFWLGCNTVYKTRTIDLEIAIPGKVSFSPQYKKIALKYNNCRSYINILAQRKLDLKQINVQYNFVEQNGGLY